MGQYMGDVIMTVDINRLAAFITLTLTALSIIIFLLWLVLVRLKQLIVITQAAYMAQVAVNRFMLEATKLDTLINLGKEAPDLEPPARTFWTPGNDDDKKSPF